jgi:hypothetical protein
MPVFLAFLGRNLKVVGVLALAAFLIILAYRFYGSAFDDGVATAQIQQVEAQQTQNIIVKKKLRRVDNEAPITASRPERSDFLRSVSRAN